MSHVRSVKPVSQYSYIWGFMCLSICDYNVGRMNPVWKNCHFFIAFASMSLFRIVECRPYVDWWYFIRGTFFMCEANNSGAILVPSSETLLWSRYKSMKTKARMVCIIHFWHKYSFLSLRQYHLVVLGLGAPLSSPTWRGAVTCLTTCRLNKQKDRDAIHQFSP